MSQATDDGAAQEAAAMEAMATALLEVLVEYRGHIPFCVGVDGLAPCTEAVCAQARGAVAWAVKLGVIDRPAWMKAAE